MLGVLLDAGVLILLLKTMTDEDIGFGLAIGIAVVAAIVAMVVALVAIPAVGAIVGLILAGAVAAICVGVAVSALFGVDIMRAFLIGAIFMVAHIGIGLGVQYLIS
jgi:hypothetical protein